MIHARTPDESAYRITEGESVRMTRFSRERYPLAGRWPDTRKRGSDHGLDAEDPSSGRSSTQKF